MRRKRSEAALMWKSYVPVATAAAVVVLSLAPGARSQATQSADVQEQVRRINDAVNRVQAQIDESQRELAELKSQLAGLQGGTATATSVVTQEQPAAAELAAAVAGIRETQGIHETQLATLDQAKVESESKYPLKVSGLILMTGSVNTQGVDVAATPTVAVHGPGSTAATIRQTVLGLDAQGPHLFGATSRADLRFDFFASPGGNGYGGSTALGVLRMRTAHAQLDWQHSKAYFALDRPLMSPDTPTSLTAVAIPPLAWSGTLWTWNPQVGGSHDFFSDRAMNLRTEAALIFVADPPQLYGTAQSGGYGPPSTTEQSRWPGAQARLALVHTGEGEGAHFGIGGFVAPHLLPQPKRFNSWAVTADFNFPVTRFTRLSGSSYYGQALGGLGEGAFKDYAARIYHNEWYYRALDDMGGWVQWKQRAGERLEFNEAFGMDNVPAHQLRPYTFTNADSYYNLARNRTISGNVIYSPSAYLLFTLEYRRIASSFVNSPTEYSDVIGLGTGYKF
ncbi:hypothetical protein [Occallatibacter riparius]|uniref:DUF3138 family protein n=1 Tax=Occallatibacter riparius TaxID=1002689 RepID=A0A9J7BH18_9BACT|nr:hypothetical protein [Occallatibacter riparius]UWZ82268.1 hypothetical protein MOP44_16995 [Occallatibacter riparius]